MDSVILFESIVLREYDRYLPSLSAGDIIVDIGAHIGDFSIPVAKRNPEIRVLSIEPHPQNHKLLLENIRLNSVSNVTPLAIAIGQASGTVNLYEDVANTGGNSIARDGTTSIPVPCISLAELFNKHHIDGCRFIKMDCEGAEYEIIRAAPLSLLRSIDTIVMEYHNNGPIEEIAEKLKKTGFTVTLTSGITNPFLQPFVNAPFCVATRISPQKAE